MENTIVSKIRIFRKIIIQGIFIALIIQPASAQSLFDSISGSATKDIETGGFLRSGLYINSPDNNTGIPVSFSDLSLNMEAGNGVKYRAYADLRYRYGAEYGERVNSPVLREAWAAWYTPYSELKAGKQIVTWSRMDIFNLQDVSGPRNDLYRSFDSADRYLGNVALDITLMPADNFSINALIIPEHRSSVLYTDFIDLPEIINIQNLSSSPDNYVSYGLRAKIYLKNFSADISYFDGYNPLPGLSLDSINIQSANDQPVISLKETTYKIRSLSASMDLVTSKAILRTEAIWIDPDLDYRSSEHVMLPEVKWAAGLEYLMGDIRLIAEYSGKYILDFEEPDFEPVLPEESSFNDIIALPPAQAFEYTRLQIASFNRLYNYQLQETSHYAGLNLTYDKGFSRLVPSISLIYNITADEYMISPRLEIKPVENTRIVAGAELYYGPDNSLFDLINDRLNSVFAGLRIDF